MQVGDKVKCTSDGLTHFGIEKGKIYRITKLGNPAMTLLIGDAISLKGYDNLFFSASGFKVYDYDFVDELIQKL